MIRQTTLKDSVSFEGIGIHSGETSKIIIHPTSPNSGIIFKKGANTIKAHIDNVVDTSSSTSIGDGIVYFRTIEHLMASLYLANIDNAIIEFIEGQEVPIMDGSALEIFRLLENNYEVQDFPRVFGYLSNVVRVSNAKAYIMAKSPKTMDELNVSFEGEFGSFLKNQTCTYTTKLEKPIIHENLISSRTFCHLKDAEYIKSLGLAKGGSLENTLVLTEEGALNQEGFRHQKEPVAHKLLDLIGDMYLAGFRFSANIYSYMGGHALNVGFLKEATKHIKIIDIEEVIAV